jgi:hypothetical protein
MNGSVARRLRIESLCLVALVSLAGIASGDPGTDPGDETKPGAVSEEGEPNLVLEDNCLAAWIAINNTFIDTTGRSPSAEQVGYSTGLLFQVGDFDGPPRADSLGARDGTRFLLDKITFHLKGQPLWNPLERDDPVFWINIVSDYPGHLDPISPPDALELYPNPRYDNDPCPEINAPVRCLRHRTIHEGTRYLFGIITYWQGANGYRIAARQDDQHFANRYKFWFEDDFRVEVYQVTDSGLTLVKTFAKGEIDQIKLERMTNGPQDGDKQDPPWPDPPPKP